MKTICDTHILLFWADNPGKLSANARSAVDFGIASQTLACADISLWEIAMLYAKGRINNQAGIAASAYIQDILTAMAIDILPITAEIAEIAELAQNPMFAHGDPADRLIAATAMAHRTVLITADEKLHALPGLHCIW